MRLIAAPIIFFIICLQSFTASASEQASLERLIAERLSYMQQVAAYKWLHKKPIEDLAREADVIEAAVKSGLNHNIKPESSGLFFALQIIAAKEIQTYWFNHWHDNAEKAPVNAPSLKLVVRPALITLGDKIIAGLAENNGRSLRSIKVTGLTPATASELITEAQKIQKFSHQLDMILATKTIRIGTTGDYAPFSASDSTSKEDDRFTGFDIDMAKDLAQSLGVEIQWQQTSWPTLMKDLEAGKFDIAMSGISKNLQRQRSALFSVSYQLGGKSAIMRCEDQTKFRTLADIDAKSTKVVVNPGGTNHKFALANIKKAKLKIHPDNRTIFDLIISTEADVMITDSIEIALQSKKHPELCGISGGERFTYSEKAYLMPQDLIWQDYVNTWLELRIASGEVKEMLEKSLTEQASL